MAIINGSGTGIGAEVDTTPQALRTALYDGAGNPALKQRRSTQASTDRLLPVGGVNDDVFRTLRVNRTGALAIDRYTPLVNFNMFTAALPPTWLAPATTMTVTYATTTGAFLNAAATGAINTNASLISMQALPKWQKSLLASRHRIRITKGGTNGQADWGLFGSQAPANAVQTNGAVWLYGADGTLKPTYYFNGAVAAQGSDIASSIGSDTQYYVFDVIMDDDSIDFICQDPVTNAIVSHQSLDIPLTDIRIGLQPYFFLGARCWCSTANVGTATKMYVGDATAFIFDVDTNKPWPHMQASTGMGAVTNPTIAATQLANWANSAAPASATLSNTAAGYTTLGGQFQWAAVAGAETDYALFAFTVPTGVKLIVTGIGIDTMNTGAAVATTATWLSWFAAADDTAATLATNSFRVALGNQVFPIAAAIGTQATPINLTFQTPLVTNSGRFFKVAVKLPLSTATASQVIRGTVRVEGYFE